MEKGEPKVCEIDEFTYDDIVEMVSNLDDLLGDCWYPVDWVPLHTSFKSRQVAGSASTRCHVPYDSKPHLTAEMGSGAAMCPIAPDLTSWLRWDPALPRVIWLRTSAPG
jgi:hypothetical protein